MDYHLREPLHILKKQTQDDDCGGIKISWRDDGVMWGSIKFISHHKIVMSSHDMVKHGLVAKENRMFRIIMRHNDSLNVSDRLIWKKQLFCIVSDPVPTERLGYMQLYACKTDANTDEAK